AVRTIEEVDFLISGNLQQPRALTIDMVRRGSPRRADKQDRFKPLDLLAHLLARQTEQVTDARLENFAIVRIALHVLQHNPGIRRLYLMDRVCDVERDLRALKHGPCRVLLSQQTGGIAGRAMWIGASGHVARQFYQARKLETRIARKRMLDLERELVEVLPKQLGITADSGRRIQRRRRIQDRKRGGHRSPLTNNRISAS